MDSLPPIPTPVAQRWREFRIRVLPIFFFVVLLGVVVILWRGVAVPPTIAVGFVETNGATVNVPISGLVTKLNVKRFDHVNANQELCQIVIKDPKVLHAELSVITNEIYNLRISGIPIISQATLLLNYNQARVDLMRARADQATAQINLRQAEYEFNNAKVLFNEKPPVVTETFFLQAKAKYESLKTQVDEREKLIESLSRDLQNFVVPQISSSNGNILEAAIAVQDAKIRELEATASPISLTAPISGMVMNISHCSGEYLKAGETILVINATESEQIIGYVRQPMSVELKVGMPVQVRARTASRHTAPAKIKQLGAQIEPFSAAMLPNPQNQKLNELGLPIQVTLPTGLKLVPGELVDLIFEK